MVSARRGRCASIGHTASNSRRGFSWRVEIELSAGKSNMVGPSPRQSITSSKNSPSHSPMRRSLFIEYVRPLLSLARSMSLALFASSNALLPVEVSLRIELLKVCTEVFGLFFVLDAGEYLFGPRN